MPGAAATPGMLARPGPARGAVSARRGAPRRCARRRPGSAPPARGSRSPARLRPTAHRRPPSLELASGRALASPGPGSAPGWRSPGARGPGARRRRARRPCWLAGADGGRRRRAARSARTAGRGRRGGRAVEPVQVVQLHQRDEVRAVVRVGRVDAGQVVGERVRDRAVGHRPRVVAAGREQLGVVGDRLGVVVVDAERRLDGHPLAVVVLRGRQVDAARGPVSLDAEEVVVLGRELAASPRRTRRSPARSSPPRARPSAAAPPPPPARPG